MKNAVAALLLTAASPVFAGCYDLDATQAQYDVLNASFANILRPTTSGQTMHFNLVDTGPNLLNAVFYQALSDTGADALTTALATDLPQGDVTLPSSGEVHVQIRIDSFPWTSFEYDKSVAGLSLLIATGNEGQAFPRQEMDADIFVINSRNYVNNNFAVSLHVDTADGEATQHLSQQFPVTPGPDVPDTIGYVFDMSNGRTIWLTAGGVRQFQVKDSNGVPIVVPSGVNKVFFSIGGYMQAIRADDDVVLANPLMQSTLITSVCNDGTTQPPLLPNGKPFKGNGHAYGIFGKPEEKKARGLR